MKRREFIWLSAARLRGRSRRARSNANGCGASACSWASPRTIRKRRRASQHSSRDLKDADGWRAAISTSTTASRLPGVNGFRLLRKSWSPCNLT